MGSTRAIGGTRLDRLTRSVAALVEAEIARFPDDVGHVLGSSKLRSHQSLAGRLGYFARKGRDALYSGATRCLKLIGYLQLSRRISN
jgi:hypothetical protein